MKLQNRLSFISLLVILGTLLTFISTRSSFNVLTWDVFGYYLYLPSFFIYHDVGLSNLEWVHDIINTYHTTDTLYQYSLSPIGHYVNKYSMGMAFLYLPFFLIGHAIAFIMDYPLDGFSLPYQLSIFISGVFYFVIGLIYLRKVLLYFFSDKIVAMAILLIGLGTNYFHIQAYSNMMSHNYLFTLYTLLLWVTVKWNQQMTTKNSLMLGGVMGIIVLVRPTEIICILIPLLFGVISKKELKSRFLLIYQKRKFALLSIFAAFLIGVTQLIYWKVFGGKFIYYSYNNAGEGLDLFFPHIFNVLLSFRKGWLIYTPLMIFSLIGFYALFKNYRKLFWSTFVFFLLNFYLVSSWTTWWYAGSFGQRALMQSYVVMALPLGAFLSSSIKRNKVIRNSIGVILLSFVGLNLFQTWQIRKGIINDSRMTKSYYMSVFGQLSPPTEEQKKLLLIKRSTTAIDHFTNKEDYQLVLSEKIDFEAEDTGNFSTTQAHSGEKVFKMSTAHPFSPKISKKFEELTTSEHAWVKISCWVYPSEGWKESQLSLIATFSYKNKPYKYRGMDTEKVTECIPNQWNKIEMIYLTPDPRTKRDEFSTYTWLRGNEEILVDDLEVEVYNKIIK